MTRIVLVVLLLLATVALGFAQIHCSLEDSDSAEPCCELCHLSDATPLARSAPRLFSPTPTFQSKDALPRRAPLVTAWLARQGRAPPL